MLRIPSILTGVRISHYLLSLLLIDDADPGTTLKFLEEGLLMKKFIHPNIMPLIGLTFDPKNNPAIVLPLMANGDLKTYLRSESTVNIQQLVWSPFLWKLHYQYGTYFTFLVKNSLNWKLLAIIVRHGR